MSDSTKKALDLLVSSLGRDSNTTSREWGLLATVLQYSDLWSRKADDLLAQVRSPTHPDAVVWPLSLCADTISQCSDALLAATSKRWADILTHSLKEAGELTVVKRVCSCVSALLDRCHASPQVVPDFSSRQLPAIMSSLLWFTAADPSVQCLVLPLVTKCTVYFSAPCVQFRSQVHKWACVGLFSLSEVVSQESSRLLVLTNGHQWLTLVQTLVREIHTALSLLMNQDPKEQTLGLLIDVPPLPTDEPKRSSLLLHEAAVFTRTLCYSLLFSSQTHSRTLPSVPVYRILGLALETLATSQQQVTGMAYDKLILHSIVPVLHTLSWNLISVLIRVCHSHLFPYATPIESTIIQGLSFPGPKSRPLVLAVHKALSAWLLVKKDFDIHFVSVVGTTLLKQSQSESKDDSLCVSSLKVLSVLVRSAGSLLPHSLTLSLTQLPFGEVSLTTHPHLVLPHLDILLACATSSNPLLSTCLGGAIRMFHNMETHHQSLAVVEFCRSALVQCELVQHPIAPPIPSQHPITPPIPSHSAESWGNSVSYTGSGQKVTQQAPRELSPLMTGTHTYSQEPLQCSGLPIEVDDDDSKSSKNGLHSLYVNTVITSERVTHSPHETCKSDVVPLESFSSKKSPTPIPVGHTTPSNQTNTTNTTPSNQTNARPNTELVVLNCSSDDSDTEGAIQLFVDASPDVSDMDV